MNVGNAKFDEIWKQGKLISFFRSYDFSASDDIDHRN